MTVNPKTVCRKHFKNMGFKAKYNQEILPYINFQFDIFNNDKQIAVYVLGEENSLSALVDVAKVINAKKPDLKICLCVPGNLSLPASASLKASESNIDLYIIHGERLSQIIKSSDKRIIEKHKIEEIRKTLKNINRICKIKWSTPLFKIKGNLFSKLVSQAKNEKDFIYQISTISSIIESIHQKELKKEIKPHLRKDKEIFEKNQSISILELFLKKKKIDFYQSSIKIMRDLRDLRNIPPVHPSSKAEKICKKFIGKKPSRNDEWQELSEIVFKKFSGCLTLLRNVLR